MLGARSKRGKRPAFVQPAALDTRLWRQIIAYDDAPGILLAVDVLECGHRVKCSRFPGGAVRGQLEQ
ncbi:MAG TPA: hypothetical protein VGS01_07745 [Candidatus Limnocylindria bacterium]|nr:hypothetical protein [Candidatus Limnocylindria bacterium]